jgi:hypothetical protein
MTPLQLDGDMARRFLDLLDPDHDAFLFAAGDDNKERAKATIKAGKPPVGRPSARLDRCPPGLAQSGAGPGLGHLHHRPAHEGQAPAGQERGGHSGGVARVGYSRATTSL